MDDLLTTSEGADKTALSGQESSQGPTGLLSGLLDAAGQSGEEPSDEAQPGEPDETEASESPSVEDEPEPGEAEQVAGDDKTEAEPEADESDPRDAQIRQLMEQQEVLLRALNEQQREPEAPKQAPPGPDPQRVQRVKDGILRYWGAGGKEAEVLASLPPDVRQDVQARAHTATEKLALLAADDGEFVRSVVAPQFVPALQYLAERIATLEEERNLESLAVKHREVFKDEKALKEVAELSSRVNGKPPRMDREAAVEFVRMKRELAALNARASKVSQKEQQQKALEASRRVQAAPKPNVRGKVKPVKPKPQGGYVSLSDWLAAEAQANAANSEE